MRRLLFVGLLVMSAASHASDVCTPFDLDPRNKNVSNNREPDGGMWRDSRMCCKGGQRCQQCTPTPQGQPVDPLTGFAWVDRTDVDFVQPWGPPVRFARHYATTVAMRGVGSALGTGWTHTYNTYLGLEGATPASRVVIFTGEVSGEEYNLIGGSYSSIQGSDSLVWDATTQLYIANRRDGSALVFDVDGRLRVMRGADGGEAQLRYGGDDAECTVTSSLPAGALCRVDFLFGRRLWFSYTAGGLLQGVAFDRQQTLVVGKYDYYSDGSLKTATAADGYAESYTYGFTHISWAAGVEVNLLLQATDADGKLVESFGYAFDHLPSDGPARVVQHSTADSDYTFTYRYLDKTTLQLVRQTFVRSNKANINYTFDDNAVTSECYLNSAGLCDSTRLHTYVKIPGRLDIQCEQQGSGKYLRHERDSFGRIVAEYAGLSQCDVVTPAARLRGESYGYLRSSSLLTSTSRASVDPSPPPGFQTFTVADYTAPGSAVDAYCGAATCQTPQAFNVPPLTSRVQRRVVVGRTLADVSGGWTTQARVTSSTFDGSGRLASTDGPRRDVADVTTYTWDTANPWAMASVTPPGRNPTTYSGYDLRAHAHTVTDEAGQLQAMDFDEVGRMKSLLVPGRLKPTKWQYLPSGRLDTVTAPTDAVDVYSYDSDGQLQKESRLAAAGSTQPDMVRGYTRNLKRVTQVSDAEAQPLIGVLVPTRQVGYGYDRQGRRTRTLSAGPSGGAAVGIDDDERLAWRSDQGRFKPTDPTPLQSHTYSYDDFGNVTAVQQLVSGAMVTVATFTWDVHNNLASYTDAKGVTIRYQHDDFDQLVEVESPDFGLRRFVYDEAGNLVKERRGDGTILNYQYDASNRLVSVKLGAQALETYDWGGAGPAVKDCAGGLALAAPLAGGRLTHVHDAVGDWYFGYWPDGRVRYEALVSAGATCGKILGWEYDSAGLLTAMTYPSGARVEYGYPSVGALLHERPTSLTLVVGATRTPLLSSIVWAAGEVVGYTTGAGTSWSLRRSLDGTPSSVTAVDSNLRTQDFSAFDGWGNPNAIQESLWKQATAAQQQVLTHNDLPALTSASGPGYSPQVYSYLVSGDRKAANGNAYCYEAGTHRLALVAGTSRFSSTKEGSVQRKLDSNGAISTWCYGPRGEVTSTVGGGGDVSTLLTNFRRQRAVEVWPINGLKEDFRVDESSRLLVESGVASLTAQYPRPTREYVWLGGHPVAVLESSEAADGTVSGRGVTYLYSGQLGEVLVESDAAGALRRQYTYTPFGARQEVLPPSDEVPTQVSISALPVFTNLWGYVSGVTGARALKLHFTDSTMAGCAVTIRTQDFAWLADIASLKTGDSTGWLPSERVALEVKGCAGPGGPWRPTIGVTSDVGPFSITPRTEATANPYPASGQHFSLSLSQPSYVQLESVALASCDSLEARDGSGATLWQWKPGGYAVSGLTVPDSKALTSRLQGNIDVGVWGKGCNATEAKAGFKLTQVLSEGAAAGGVSAPVSIGLPGQKYRYDGMVDNWYRAYEPRLGRYLSVDPELSGGVSGAAVGAEKSASPYSYGSNEPATFLDPDGRRIRVDAVVLAGSYAGCALTGESTYAVTCLVDETLDVSEPSECRQDSGCGLWGFDIDVGYAVAVRYKSGESRSSADKLVIDLGRPGRPGRGQTTVPEHERNHVDDLLFYLGEFNLNNWLKTEGFATHSECDRARKLVKLALTLSRRKAEAWTKQRDQK